MKTSPIALQTILIVDDESDLLETLRQYIERSLPGARVLAATSAGEGLRLLLGHDVDLILADYRIPGRDGISFLKEARLRRPQARRALMTAFPKTDTVLEALHEGGIQRFIDKRWEPHRFDAALAALLAEED